MDKKKAKQVVLKFKLELANEKLNKAKTPFDKDKAQIVYDKAYKDWWDFKV